MSIFDKLTDKLKTDPRTIVLPDGPDPRVMDAAEKLSKNGVKLDLRGMLLDTIGNNKGFSDNDAEFTLK